MMKNAPDVEKVELVPPIFGIRFLIELFIPKDIRSRMIRCISEHEIVSVQEDQPAGGHENDVVLRWGKV